MLQKIKNSLKKRKVKVFLVFLLASTLAWFISKLSEPYIRDTTLVFNYTNSNDNLLLVNTSQDEIEVQLEAVGFQFLGFNFKKKELSIDLAEVTKDGRQYYLTPQSLQTQIEKELPSSMRLVNMANDTLLFDFQEVITKNIPIKPQLNLSFSQNYQLEGALKITPETVTITGPKNEVDTINSVKSATIEFTKLTSNFSSTVALHFSDALQNTTFSATAVTVEGNVSKFSEKMITVPIRVLNRPSGSEVKTFPAEVNILCKGTLGSLKGIKKSDFAVVANFRKNAKKLTLSIDKKPESLSDAVLQETEVEYVLKRKQ